MLKSTHVKTSNEGFFSVYDFEEINDVLEIHEHTDNTSHYSVVTNGMLQMFNESGNIKKLTPGIIEKIPMNYKHGFRALTKDARLVNIPYKD